MFMNGTGRAVVLLLLMTGWAHAASAQGGRPSVDLGDASLADLMKIEITSVSHKEQRVIDTAAAVYVITAEDIRRSGLTSVPELLRLAPGVQVAQINGSKWAVSVRGFNGLYSNKLLVLIDGRTIYNPIFAGVTWDSEDLMVENIDRIEIVRGPGGAVWGANAVNGVINVVTKTAAATQGMFVRAGAGSLESTSLALRYGGTAKSLAYRAYAQWARRDGSDLPPRLTQKDDADGLTLGGRVDGTGTNATWMIQLNAISARSHGLWARPMLGLTLGPTLAPTLNPADVLTDMSHMAGGALLGRWTRQMASGRSLQVESSFDVSRRNEPVGDYGQHSAEAGVQYRAPIGARHDFITGAGYRSIHASFDGRVGIALVPAEATQEIFNTFIQDEIGVVPERLSLTLGAKVEHDAAVGFGIQPTGRLMWRVTPNQRVWAAISRALRTPSVQDRGIRVEFPPVRTPSGKLVNVEVSGNPDARSESVVSLESGYRVEVGDFTLDAAVFTSAYGRLRTTEPQEPYLSVTSAGPAVVTPMLFGNRMHADSRGVELSADWQPVPFWRLDAGYTAFHVTPHLDADSLDLGMAAYEGNAPRNQWQARSWIALPARLQVDALLLRVGAIRGLAVPAYTRADLRVEFAATRQWSLIAVGQNLLDPRHVEFAGVGVQVMPTLQPRAGRVQLVWRF
jgi:iron complex outermembrane receptor protein